VLPLEREAHGRAGSAEEVCRATPQPKAKPKVVAYPKVRSCRGAKVTELKPGSALPPCSITDREAEKQEVRFGSLPRGAHEQGQSKAERLLCLRCVRRTERRAAVRCGTQPLFHRLSMCHIHSVRSKAGAAVEMPVTKGSAPGRMLIELLYCWGKGGGTPGLEKYVPPIPVCGGNRGTGKEREWRRAASAEQRAPPMQLALECFGGSQIC
jgi:hypothetical protein